MFLASAFSTRAQTITIPPQSQTANAGSSVTFTITATGTPPLTYQWRKDGAALAGATSASLTVSNIQPQNAGIYTAVVSSGATSASASAILGFTSTAKVTGAGTEVGADILHPTGNVYDQVLLQGPAAAVTADPGQVTRISYIDLNDDIVQVEFAGAGTLTLLLDSSSGPAAPAKYNQANVLYMKGHAGIVIAGGNETTNVSVFSVGRANAVNQAIFRDDVTYDGHADIAYIAITGGNGKFGGLRSANASYFATKGFTGIYAPGIQFGGPVFVGDIDAWDVATPVFIVGSAADVRITGGDLLQTNGQPVQVAGLPVLKYVDGSTSHGTLFPVQLNKGRLVQDGTDLTAQLAPLPPATLYLAQLRSGSGTADSTASGYASILINPDGTATVSVTFSNLSSPETSAHLQLGSAGDFVLNLPLGQVPGRIWTFAPSSSYSTSDLIVALNGGNIFVGLDSAKYPGGELRGNFIVATGSQTFTAPAAPPVLPPGALTVPTQTDAARFLTQATFGPTLADINALMSRGITGWIDDQMALPASSLFAGLRADVAAFPNPPAPVGVNFVKYRQPNRRAAWWKIAVTGPDQLRQRVAFALSELLVIGDVGDPQEGVAKYYDLLADGAFGNFRVLLENVTLNPVMGHWLSHLQNQKADPAKGTSPDENYAREIQQLFTIGLVQLQPDGTLLLDGSGQPIPTYEQTTISETAKVLTGWAFANEASTNFGESPPETASNGAGDTNGWLNPMRYFDAFHDKTQKKIVGLQQVPLANAAPVVIPAAQTGPADLKIFLDTLFNHPNTGPFICKQLIQRLVTSNPSPGYVYRVAQAFANDGTGTRGNLGAVVRAILTDYEARSPNVLANMGYGKLKEPVLRLSAFFRALNLRAPNGRFMDGYFMDPRGGYNPSSPFVSYLIDVFAQSALDSPTVFNFFSPDYAPQGAIAAAGLVAPELEITDSSFAILVPNAIIDFMYRNPATLPEPAVGPSPFFVVDYSLFLPQARTPTSLLDQLNLLFCSNQMIASTRTQIISTLQALPSNASDTELVQTAIHLTIVSPDGATQR